ncbi:MAG TPA: hypothetical protein ENK18_03195 [Deltaproteobacteria bacterium]|nr:hypothetical protein [Deltaproteobacteria bacterium]
MEDEIVAAGAQIIWVLEADVRQTPGTAELCMAAMDGFGSLDQGWCVGDGQTEPVPGTFDNSPFSQYRGFDIIVHRETMEIVWSSSHGSPSGNENLDGDGVLAAVVEAIGTR